MGDLGNLLGQLALPAAMQGGGIGGMPLGLLGMMAGDGGIQNLAGMTLGLGKKKKKGLLNADEEMTSDIPGMRPQDALNLGGLERAIGAGQGGLGNLSNAGFDINQIMGMIGGR